MGISRNQKEIPELESTVIKMKNSPRLKDKLEQAEERTSELEDKTVDIIKSEEKKKRLKKSEPSPRNL